MRKYYHLNKKNDWSNGLNIFQLLYCIIIGRIKRFDIIWHTGLCPKGESHPEKCVHPSIQVREISYLPNWIYKKSLGLPELFMKKTKSIKKTFNKKENLEKFLKEPHEMPTSQLKDAKEKKILPTMRAIHSLSSGGEFTIDLVYITSGKEPEVKRESYQSVIKEVESNYLEFQIIVPKLPNVGGVMYKESYGLNNELYLKNESNTLRVLANSVTNFSTKYPYEPQILKGQFTQINQVVDSDYKDVFLRLVISTKDEDFKSPLSILERTGTILFDKEEFNVHHSIMGVKFRTGSGYSEITVRGKKYHYYTIEDSLTFLECLEKNDIDSFKLETGQIRLALAFLCGNFYRGEVYYLSSYTNNFSKIEGVWYEKELSEIITVNQIINPRFYFQIFENKSSEYKEVHKEYHCMFSNALFSSLCDLILSVDEIQRAIRLIVNGSGNSDPIQKGALYSVAIETLTGFFSEQNKDSLKPIKDEATFKKVEAEILKVISTNLDAIGKEGAEILTRKISSLNAPTNRDKLIKPFEIYGIELTDDNIQSIGKRNKYLHGRSPLKTKEQFELNKLALELHFLAGCLILKHVGYSGHVINLPTWSLHKDQDRFRELLLNSTQEQMELLDQLKDSIEKKDNSKFEELKAKLLELSDTNEIENLVKII